MPITVHPGPGGLVLGPGVLVSWTSDFVGPVPTGTVWDLHWFEGAEPNLAWLHELIATGTAANGSSIPFVVQAGKQSTIATPNTIRTGAPAHLSVELRTPTGVVDSGTFSANWDTSAGIAQQLLTQSQAVQGGFTVEDRAQLALAVSNTMVDLTAPALPVDPSAFPISRVPFISPITAAERMGPFLLTGRGSLPLAPLGPLSIFMGMRWFFAGLPPGFGFTPGAIDEFERRIVQLVPVYTIGSGEEIGEPVIDATQSGGFYEFPVQAGLVRIEYQVAPGCEVSLFMYRFRPV